MSYFTARAIGSPEFINVVPKNKLISECEIKVLYLGKNRNKTFISKDTAKEMANSLPGNPIVGYFKEDKQDFADHGKEIRIDDSGVHFDCKTFPYGFVAPDAKVWFQKFEETDVFGNTIEREYLMTTGYLWTGQYEEAKLLVEQSGKGQSMELDEESLSGQWANDPNDNMEFFIINDAIFSKLCALGDDVEPCFEGANITAKNISKNFTKENNDFNHTLFSMMQELTTMLKGDSEMKNQEPGIVNVEETKVDPVIEETNPASEDYAKTEDDKKKKDPETKEEPKDDDKSKEGEKEDNRDQDKENKKEESKKDDEDKKKKYSLEEEVNSLKEANAALEASNAELVSKYEALSNDYAVLKADKDKRDLEDKKNLINDEFYMLADEDKKDVIEHINDYSLEEIESKLSVICVRKKVNFNLEDSSKNDNIIENKAITYNLDSTENSVPAWIAAIKNTQNKENI